MNRSQVAKPVKQCQRKRWSQDEALRWAADRSAKWRASPEHQEFVAKRCAECGAFHVLKVSPIRF